MTDASSTFQFFLASLVREVCMNTKQINIKNHKSIQISFTNTEKDW